MEDIVGFIVLVLIIFLFMYGAGRCFESDLEDMEKTNLQYRKFLKDKYNI